MGQKTEDIRKWMLHIPCLWTGRINIIKVTILPVALCRRNAVPIKIPVIFFKDILLGQANFPKFFVGSSNFLIIQSNSKKKKIKKP